MAKNMDNDPIERAYWKGQLDATKFAITELQRGPWWYFRDWLARLLHWIAIRVEPTT